MQPPPVLQLPDPPRLNGEKPDTITMKALFGIVGGIINYLESLAVTLKKLTRHQSSSYQSSSDHGSSHGPGGSDPLDTPGAPTDIAGGSSSVGSGPSFAYEDHEHDVTNLRIPEGTQSNLALAFQTGAFGAGDDLGLYRKAEEEIHIPSAATGDGGLHVSLVSSSVGNPRGTLFEAVAEDDEGIASLGAYGEAYGSGLFAETFGSAATGDSLGRPKATSAYYGCFARDLVVGLFDEFDLYLVTDSFPRVRVDKTDGYAAFAHNLVTTPASPAQLTASVNDYAPANAGVLRLTADAAWSITGMVAAVTGTQRTLVNVGANAITLEHQDAGSAEANRFLCASGADVILAANEMAWTFYDSTTTRWRVGKFS